MSERVLRLALRLHPVEYRRERGEEIAAVFADTTADAGRWATARELFDLAGHGVRARLGLRSSGTLARLAAMVAPFAAAAAAGVSLMDLYMLARDWLRHGDMALWVPSAAPYYYAYWINRGSEALFLAAAGAAVLGRWTVARLLGPFAVPLALVAWSLQNYGYLAHHPTVWIRELVGLFVQVGPQALWVLILLIAPPDLLGPAVRRRGLAAVAGVLFGGVFWGQAVMFELFRSLRMFDRVLLQGFPVCELLLLLVAVPMLRRGRYAPAAAALAGAPIGLVVLVATLHALWSPYNRAEALAVLGVLGVVAVVGVIAVVAMEARWRSSAPDRRPPAVG
ncbi:hypothetical protein [Kitasatospora paranensis]|uniref:Acyltransferase 3 domain-containing protein n=1 Tax=Kitasatospora paranensis TaxID=258053 RepID=A0ABW2G3Q7_9ACTN